MGYKAGMTHIVREVEKPGSKLHKKETCEVRRAVSGGVQQALCCSCLQAGPAFSAPTLVRGCIGSAAA